MKVFPCLLVMSALALACEASRHETDAAVGAVQPACPQLAALCPPALDASSASGPPPVLDAAPSPSTAAPIASGDASNSQTSMPSAQDAAVPSAAPDAAGDASASASDAQLDSATPTSEAGAAFPPISDPAAKGPYTSKTVSNTGPGGTYTIFHPAELGPNGLLHPIVTWGNGGFTTPVDYPQLPHLASHGFVVIAANDSLVTGPQVRAGLDWIVQQNELATSPFYKKLDLKRVAGVGYSNGGLATLDVADDPRYLTIVILSGANLNEDARAQNMPKLRTPIAYLCTDDDASEGNCSADFAVVKVPAFYGVMRGTAHTDVTTLLGLGVPAAITRVSMAATAWLRWQVMADASFKPTFVGADCALCKDSNWTVQQKSLQ